MKINSRPEIRFSGILIVIVTLALPYSPVLAEKHSGQAATTGDPAAMYAGGVTWERFLADARVNREAWQENAGRDVSADLVQRFRRAGKGLQLLVITADWCTDSVHSVPYIASLASEAGVDLRIVDFRTGRPVMEAHRTPDGRASTPTVVLLRENRAVTAWVERPAGLQWWYLRTAGQVDEDELQARKIAWYEWSRGADALTEIVALAEQAARPKKPARRGN